MRQVMRGIGAIVVLLLVMGLLVVGCGGDDGSSGGSGGDSWCPGTVCTNCATDPNCDITCPQGQVETCVGGAYFDADPDLRCAFCSN